MKITIEGVDYDLPTSLSDITLAQRVLYDQTYGKDLRDKLAKIIEMKDSMDRELEMGEYQCDLACKSISFFGNVPLHIIQNTALHDVLIIHGECLKAIAQEQSFSDEEFMIDHEIEWNGEVWIINPPELKHTSSTTFGEFLDSKQWVKNLFDLGNERWEALVMLCCIYLRKKGEVYNEILSEENGDRYKIMQTLPLNHALNVGFFLSGSMHTYMKTFHSSSQLENQVSLN